MTQAPEKPSQDQIPSLNPNTFSSTDYSLNVNYETSSKLSSPIYQKFNNIGIRKKLLLVFIGLEFMTILGLWGVGNIQIKNNGLKLLTDQSTSELEASKVNYEIKINQMGFGFRGQSDNSAVINAALAKANGRQLTSQQRQVVKNILQNEIKARNIEYATLVGRDKKIIVSANNDRTGEVFDPNGLVSQVINDPQQIKTSEILSWQDIKKENPPLLPDLTPNEDVLIRNTVTPVFRPNSKQVIGILVSGDVVDVKKNAIVVNTINQLNGGYSAIYRLTEDNQFQLVTSQVKFLNSKEKIEDQANEAIATNKLLNEALNNPQQIVSVDTDEVAGKKYTLTAQAILNNQQQPIGFLVRGTGQDNLDTIIENSGISQGITAVGILVFSFFLTIPLSQSIASRIESLEYITTKFADGEYGARVDSVGKDEIGSLSRTFNALADSISTNESLLMLNANQASLFQTITGARTIDEDDINQVFDQTLTQAREILRSDRLVIYRFQPDWSGYISNEASEGGLPSALKEQMNDPCIPLELRQAYINGRVVPTANVYEAGFAPEHEALMDRLEIKSNLVVPILSQGTLFALLIAHHCEDFHDWTTREINFMEQLAIRYGVILDRVNILKNQILTARRAEQLKDITASLAVTLNRQDVLNNSVELIRQAIDCDRTLVYEFDESWQGTIVAESVMEVYPQALGSTIKDPCFADKYVERYEQGRVQSTPDIYKAGLTECHLQQLEPFQVKANLVAPILVNSRLTGLLICHECSAPRYWQQDEIDLFTQVATQLGLALERVRLADLQQKSENEQREARQQLQQRALELLMQVDPVSQGDLTIRASVTEDEIGTIADSYNATVESLSKIVKEVQSVALQVADTTTNRENEVTLLQTEIAGQVLNISEALEKVNVMNSSSKMVAQSAQQAEEALAQAQESVALGDSAMNSTVKSIIDIRATVQQATEQMKKLEETTESISKVVSLIGRFAAQTHLLALKASIEAARAGEQGQGFAVIADEVRTLATQSAQATADIEKLVNDILAETKTVSMAMEEGNQLVVSGSSLVEETRKTLNQITSITLQVNELVETIASAAFEQSENSEQVRSQITEVAQVAEKTNVSVNQLSDSFKQLKGLADQLESNVSQFKVG